MFDKQYYVYILTTQANTVLYTGVTNDIVRRVYEHKQHFVPGFTRRYNVDKLVYYEATEDVTSAIAREKQIKHYSRNKKIKLITDFNKEWQDLYNSLVC
jgi:putative endonuclease